MRQIEIACEVKIAHRYEMFKIDGHKAKAQRAMEVLQALYEIAKKPIPVETIQLMLAGDMPKATQIVHTHKAPRPKPEPKPELKKSEPQ